MEKRRSGRIALYRVAAQFLALLAIPAPSAWAASPGYDYEIQVKTGDVIDGIPVMLNDNVAPFLADDGAVLFGQGFDTRMCCSAIFSKRLPSRGKVVIQAGDVIDGFTVSLINSASRNDRGEDLFILTYSAPTQGAGIFRRNAKVVVPGDVISDLTIVAVQGCPNQRCGRNRLCGVLYHAGGNTQLGNLHAPPGDRQDRRRDRWRDAGPILLPDRAQQERDCRISCCFYRLVESAA